MVEVSSTSEQNLEALFLSMQQNKLDGFAFDGTSFTPKDFEKIESLSRLFSKLLIQSGLSSVRSLNVIIPGAIPHEIVAVLFAARALGVEQTQITYIEKDEDIYQVTKSSIAEIFGQELTDADTHIQFDGVRINLKQGNAASFEYRQTAVTQVGDANMVFIGNSSAYFGNVFENWAPLGLETNKPFLFAVTTTDYDVEPEDVEKSFRDAWSRADLKPVPEMYDVVNPHAIKNPTKPHMTHSKILAVVR